MDGLPGHMTRVLRDSVLGQLTSIAPSIQYHDPYQGTESKMAADPSDLLQLMQAIKLVSQSFIRRTLDLTNTMQVANKNSSKLVRAWFYVPLGITIILAVNFGVDSIFYKFNVSFPASVTCMMLLFFALIASESLLGTHKTRKLVNIIDVPVSHGYPFQ